MGDSKADQKMSLPMANKPQLYLRPNIAAAVDNGLLHRFMLISFDEIFLLSAF